MKLAEEESEIEDIESISVEDTSLIGYKIALLLILFVPSTNSTMWIDGNTRCKDAKGKE